MKKNKKVYDLMQYRLTRARAEGALAAGNPMLASDLFACADFLHGQLVRALSKITDEHTREAMSLRYLEGMEWSEVAEKMHFSERWVLRLHQKGLEVL